MGRKPRKVKSLRVQASVKVRRGKHWDTGQVTAVEVNGGVYHYTVELKNGVAESFPSYLVEALPKKGTFERLKVRRLALPVLVAAGTLVTAAATLGVWLWPHGSRTSAPLRPAPPKTSLHGLWLKDLDGTNKWTRDLVLGRNDRLWVSGLVQSPKTGASGAVLRVWQSTTKSQPGTSIVHLGFSENAESPVSSSYSALVRHGPDTFLALNISSAVLTDEEGNQLATLGNAAVTVPARNKRVPVFFELGPLASSERIYFEMWSKLIPASSVEFGFTPHSIWWQEQSGKMWLYADRGTVG
ncbi:MAG: hypothetical protein ACTHLH_08275 [Solirubrobacterales bacterium]